MMESPVLEPPREKRATLFRTTDGVELVGEYQGSGYRDPRYVVVRGDGQVAQLSELLYRVAAELDGRTAPEEIARRVAATTGRELSAEDVTVLVREHLVPVGLAVEDDSGSDTTDGAPADGASAHGAPADGAPAHGARAHGAAANGAPAKGAAANGAAADRGSGGGRTVVDADPVPASPAEPAGAGSGAGAGTAPQRPDHLLMLRFRLPVVPASVTWVLAGLFRWTHRPAVVLATLSAVLAVDVVVLTGGGLTGAAAGARDLVASPQLVLAVLGVLLATGAFHEIGHVSACRYGGARPGPMGVGIYLVWPAFYSTVTDAYRLSRAGRLRTDLGGVYFNAVVLGVLGAAYLFTGADWLLVVVALLHVETARQFLPMIRLDGYYVLSDIVGVPDLFSYLGPVLRSRWPGATPDPRLRQLRPGVRRTVELWVALVVPVLAFFLIGFLVSAPAVLPDVVAGVGGHLDAAAAGIRSGATAEAVLGGARAALLVLPVLGAALLLGTVLRRLLRLALARLVVPRTAAGGGLAVLVAVLLPVASAGALAVAGAGAFGAPVPSADPFGAGERQLAALRALLGGAGPATAGVLTGAAAAVLLWPLARRLGLPAPIAGLAVVMAGAMPPLVALQASADPAGPAAFWLVCAAVLAGRGPAAGRAAYLALGVAALTSPVAGVAAAAFVAHAVHARQFGPRLRPAGRRAVAVAAGGVAAFGGGMLIGIGLPGPPPGAGLVAFLAAGAVVLLLTWRFRAPLAPVATGAAVLAALAVVPGARTEAVLVLGPVLAMLGAGVADRALPRDHPARAGGVLGATALVLAVASVPLMVAAAGG